VSVDGILNILKPPGTTSFAVVSLLRRLSGERRVGHAGTLDPDATGVLVVCLGQGTRVIQFLSNARKTYQAEIELGLTTDTYDAAGKVVQRCDASQVTTDQVEHALCSFRGSIEQIPPMYSALKHEGRRLYRLARQGIDVPRAPRKVEIHRLELLDWQPPTFTVEMECSAGTYVRSLAHDLGTVLGCGAHVRKLVRLKSEPFGISEAVPLPLVEEAFNDGYWHRLLYPIDEVLLDWGAAILGIESQVLTKKGRPICLGNAGSSVQPHERCRAYTMDGRLLAVLRHEGEGTWHPEKVFIRPGRNSLQQSIESRRP
jgi:tRNA pseudouridine55 synthase